MLEVVQEEQNLELGPKALLGVALPRCPLPSLLLPPNVPASLVFLQFLELNLSALLPLATEPLKKVLHLSRTPSPQSQSSDSTVPSLFSSKFYFSENPTVTALD